MWLRLVRYMKGQAQSSDIGGNKEHDKPNEKMGIYKHDIVLHGHDIWLRIKSGTQTGVYG